MTLQLTAKQVAAAEACGVVFHPANPTEITRFAMQRRVFTVDGQRVLASRGGGFYETAGTLERLIEEGLRQLAELEAWEQTSQCPGQDEVPTSAQIAVASEAPRPANASAEAMPQRVNVPAAASVSTHTDPVPTPSQDVTDHGQVPGSGKLIRQRAISAGERWFTAGAVRRARAAQHWSNRQRGG